MVEKAVENGHFEHPVAVRAFLTLGEHEALSAVKGVLDNGAELTFLDKARVGHGGGRLIIVILVVDVGGGELGKARSGVETGKSFGSDGQKLLEAEQESGGAARLEDELVRKDKHGRLAEQVGVNVRALDDAEHLALDNVQHGFPDGSGNRAKAKMVGASVRVGPSTSANVGWLLGKPKLKELLGAFKGTARIVKVIDHLFGAAAVGVDGGSDAGSVIVELGAEEFGPSIHDLEGLDALSFFCLHEEVGSVFVEVMVLLHVESSRSVRVETVSSSFEIDGGCHLGWWWR